MLETGRLKDHARLIQFSESDVLDREILEDTVARRSLALKMSNLKPQI